jgi:signal transduction histidine kinase
MNALDDLKKSHEELKAAQMLLIRAEKLESVGRLAAGIAHEVKNPLAIMLTGLDYLASAPACVDPNVGMVCQDMKDALGRADTVIRGLLDFAASQELGVQPENLNEALERALKLLRHDLNRNRIEVNKQLAANLPIVMLDRAKMEQVFVNLIINAIYAMPNGGTLTVRTFDRQVRPDELCPGTGYRATDRFQAGEQVVVVEVDDTGTGIPSDKLSMLFEPFFTTKPTGQGTGLGLAVTKKIIDMHGGTIGLHNRPEGGVRATIMVKAADPK